MTFQEGQTFEQEFVVTADVHDGFIELFKDYNPLHTDESFATQRGFRGRVMQGNILNGFLSCFIGEHLPTKNVIIYSQSIFYTSAVYLNDKVLLEAAVSGIFESVSAVEFKFSFRRSADAVVVAKGNIQIGVLR